MRGAEGQERISHSPVTIVGLGALGTVSSSHLCRAGVGRLRLIDRDFVETATCNGNLCTTTGRRRTVAQGRRRRTLPGEVNSRWRSTVDRRRTPRNVAAIVAGSSLVRDGTDNMETRR